MTSDNWINLTTAIGTFAAVAAALWLGAQGRRKSDAEAHTRAKLAAASISARLSTTADMIRSLSASSILLDMTIPEDAARHKALVAIRDAMTRPYFRPDEATLLALTPLEGNCAHRIARAFDYIDRVRMKAELVPKGLLSDVTTPEQRERMLSDWDGDLLSADDLLKVAVVICVDASDLGAPMPSGQELFGPD